MIHILKTMKKTLFVVGSIVGVSLVIVGIGYFLYSQINYVDLVEKKILISENDQEIFVNEEGGETVFSYSVSEWREQVEGSWDDYFDQPLMINEREVTPSNFNRFTGVSPFPGGTKKLGFVVSTRDLFEDVSLFWVMDISSREIEMIGKENFGVIGNISWSPNGIYFAYYLNTEKAPGEYLTVDNALTLEKEFMIDREEILEAYEVEKEDYSPEFARLDWADDGNRLFFTTASIEDEEEEDKWSIMVDGSELKKEE